MGWALAVFSVSAAFMVWWLHWFDLVDLEVYRAGASAFVHGHDVYLSHPRGSPLPFTYPPFAALVFVPLAVIPDLAAKIGLSVLSAGGLLLAAAGLLRLAGPRWPVRKVWTVALLVAAATPLVEPLRDTLRLGQVNLVLMALVLADLAPAGGRSPRFRGARIGIATAIKLTPGIFILYLLVTRRTREAVTAAGAAATATLLAAVVMPAESAHYWRHLVFDDSRIGSPGSVWNQSVRGALARITGSPDGAHLAWLVAVVAVLAACLLLAVRLHQSGDELTGLGVAALAGLLVSPISWNHHWVWALPLAMALGHRAAVTRRPLDLALAGGWIATFCVASMSWWSFAGRNDYHLGLGFNVAADCYILAALLAVAFVGLRSRAHLVSGAS